jgi:putative ABC transport system permease protein
MLRNYLLTAWKVFMRRKLFTAINLLCIVLTLLVLMVTAALLESAVHPAGVEHRSDRFLQVYGIRSQSADRGKMTTTLLGYKTIERYLKPLQTAHSVKRVAALTMPRQVAVYQGDRVNELQMRHVDADYWKILDFHLLAGRLPDEEDDRMGRMVAVVNASKARQLFPDRAAVGQKIVVDGRTLEVIGVVEDAAHINAFADIWAPLATHPSPGYRNELRGEFAALLLARDPADLPRIQREVERVATTFVPEDPLNMPVTLFWADSKLDVFARTLLNNQSQADSGAAALLTTIGVGMLLFMLLPALNLVNLNMGRILERSGEIGVRKAFGATSAQLAAQLVVENVLLCVAGGLIGLACTAAVLWWIEAAQLIPYLKVAVDFAVFGWGMLFALVFGLLSGAVPAVAMSRLDPVHALKGAA